MKKWLSTLALLLLLAPRAWGGGCTITGQVFNPDGTPLANGTVQFNSVVQQTLQGGVTIPPTQISTSTDAQGNLQAITIVGGLQGQFVFCSPAAGGCGNPTPVLIPVAATADISAILIGIQLAAGGNVNADNLNLTGNATIAGTLTVSGATTLSSLTLTGASCFADLGCWDSTGIVHATHVGIGSWPALAGATLQAGETLLFSATSSDSLGVEPNTNIVSGVHSDGTRYIADVVYPMWYNMVGSASNGSENGWFVFGPATVGQPAGSLPRVQYMALRPNVPGVVAGLFLESGGLDILGGGGTFNGPVYVQSGGLQVSAGGIVSNQGITIQSGGLTATGGITDNGGLTVNNGNISVNWYQNASTNVAVQNTDGNDGSAQAVFVAYNSGAHATSLGMTGGSYSGGGFFSADRGYVQSSGSGGLLIEATGAGAGGRLYLSAPNSNVVLVIGNQHFGSSNDGVSIPVATACGGGTVFGTSTDTAGSVQVVNSNSCVVQFAAAFGSVSCVCSTRATTWCSINPSASGISMYFGAAINDYASWICWDNG